ncbi:MAG: hypothetical protein ACYC39_06140 [Thiobacillus sp.]
MVKKKKQHLLLKLLAKLQLLLAKLQSKRAKLLLKLLTKLLLLLLPLTKLPPPLAKLHPLLAKLQPPLTPLLMLLRLPLLPSNSGSRNEKPAFGPVFFRLYVASIDKIIENSTPNRGVWQSARLHLAGAPQWQGQRLFCVVNVPWHEVRIS